MKKITIAALLCYCLGFGQTLIVDADFNGVTSGVPDGNIVYETTLQPDGRILLGGEITHYNSQPMGGIVRLNSNGSIDEDFVTGSGFQRTGGIARINSITLVPGKKILVAGMFTSYNGTPCSGIVRLHDNGELDTTFTGPAYSSVDASVPNIIYDVVVTADEKIYIGGDFLLVNQSTRSLVRLNSNGSIDYTFAPIAFVDGHPIVLSLAADANSKVVAGGAFSFSATSSGIARFNTNGTVDTAFQNNLDVTGTVYHLFVQPDNKILYAGFLFEDGNYTLLDRLDTDGSPDESYTPLQALVSDTGVNRVSSINSYLGNILVSGWGLSPDGSANLHQLLLLNQDGSVDDSFNTNEGFYYPWFNAGIVSMAIQPDNKIVAAGFFDAYNSEEVFNVTRLTQDTTSVSGFNANSGVLAYSQNGVVSFVSKSDNISNIKVFDIEGRILLDKGSIFASEISVYSLPINQALLCLVSLQNGERHTFKIIN